MFYVQQSTHNWLGVTTQRYSIVDKNGSLYATVSTTSKRPIPQIETCGGSGQRTPEDVIEYAQALMEGVKIYNQLLNSTIAVCNIAEPRTYDDASSKKFAAVGNLLWDDVRKN